MTTEAEVTALAEALHEHFGVQHVPRVRLPMDDLERCASIILATGLRVMSDEQAALLDALEKDDHLTAVLNCLRSCADDPLEPDRYRSWYDGAHAAIVAATEQP